MGELDLTRGPLTPLAVEEADVAAAVRALHRRRAAHTVRTASVTVAAVVAAAVAAVTLAHPSDRAVAPVAPVIGGSPEAAGPRQQPGAEGTAGAATPAAGPAASAATQSPTASPGDPARDPLASPSPRSTAVARPEPDDPGGPRRPPVTRTVTGAGTWVDPNGRSAGSDGSGVGCTSQEWCVDLVASDDGESYHFSVCRGSGSGELRFGSELETDFAIARDGAELWRWSTGQRFAATEESVRVDGPGCARWTLVWDRVLDDGTRLPGGSYRISATTYAAEVSPATTTREWHFTD